MCGIAAILSSNKDDKCSIDEFTKLVKHRGPDASGFYEDNKVALGHRRLSIIDLSHDSNQPFFYDGCWIVWNGECYDFKSLRKQLESYGYKFNTTGDTEVVLCAYKKWGIGFPSHLKGMFAIVIYDTKLNKVIAVRDRFGIKPLYYRISKNGVAFSSEIKQFTALPDWKPIANKSEVVRFLTTGVVDYNEETLFKGVYQIKPGWMIIMGSDGKLQHKEWYNLNAAWKLNQSHLEPAWSIRGLLTKSVKEHLISDVPIGSCLSGGIDSTATVCLINNLTHNNQFTITARSHNEKIDEGNWVDIVESYCKNLERRDIWPNAYNLVKELPNLTWHQDSPISSTSMYAQWEVYREASHYVKVLLDSQAADEVFAGYHTFFGVRFAILLKQVRLYTLAKEMIQSRSIPNYDQKFVMKVAAGALKKYNSVRQFSLDQIQHTSLPALLHWADRSSMAHSVESRVPFLDHQLVEAAVALDDNQKISNGNTKIVLRNALKGIIPEEIRLRRDKVGFATDEQAWISSNKSQLDDFQQITKEWNLPSSPYWREVALGVWIDRFEVSR